MRINFLEIDDGLACEISVDDTYVGTVKVDLWTGKWSLSPDFYYRGSEDTIKKLKYDSFYKAGKALVELYKKTFRYYEEDEEDEDITQEIDMRKLFSTRP